MIFLNLNLLKGGKSSWIQITCIWLFLWNQDISLGWSLPFFHQLKTWAMQLLWTCVLNGKWNLGFCRCMWQIWLLGRAHCSVQRSNQCCGWHCREMSGYGWPQQTQLSINGHPGNRLLSRPFKGLALLWLAPFHSRVHGHAWTALHLWAYFLSVLMSVLGRRGSGNNPNCWPSCCDLLMLSACFWSKP